MTSRSEPMTPTKLAEFFPQGITPQQYEMLLLLLAGAQLARVGATPETLREDVALSVNEAAKVMQVTPRRVAWLAQRGRLQATKRGKRWEVLASSAKAYRARR